MTAFRYPCTGHVAAAGFGAFLEANLGAPRANLQGLGRELGDRFGAKRVTLTNSGSSANLAAALALAERTGGGHAIAAGFTFPTTMSSLLSAGFEVSVADTDGFGLDPEAARRAITPKTRVLCVTHFLGFPARLDELLSLAREHDLLVLQDACETMDLRVGGRPAHERGTLTTWSFYHPHHLSAYGGGAVIARDERTQRVVESVTHWGRACACHAGLACDAPEGVDHFFHYVRPGHNLEMSELNACFGRFQLRSWEEQERRRIANYAHLHRALSGKPGVTVYAPPPDSGSPFVFPITVARDARGAAERLRARGVEVRTLMGGAITSQPAFRHLRDDGLARTRDLASRSFFAGIHQTLPIEDVEAVGRILEETL